MVGGALNTRIAAAAPGAKISIALAVLSILLITLLVAWLDRYSARNTEFDNCSGYAGQPSHAYALARGDRQAAEAFCRLDTPLISISIKNKDIISLQKKRLQAIEHGILVTSDEDYVPAHITFQGNVFKASVRLKGDWSHHVEHLNRWSLRVVMSGDDNIMGRKRFSLQTFEMRGYDKDPLYAQHLAGIGLITPRYKPIRLEVNGEDWGTMIMEDHFSRELVEARRRKESVIGRFDESAMWSHRFHYPDYGPYDNVFTSPFKTFNNRAIRRSAVLQSYSYYLRSVVAAWQEGRLALADILDMEKFADFIVASEGWDGWHTFRWHNMRFYLNPYTMKLEPVPFDNGWGVWPLSMEPVQAKVTGAQMLSELINDARFWQILEHRMPTVLQELRDADIWGKVESNAEYLEQLLIEEGERSKFNLQEVRRNMDYLAESGVDFFYNLHEIPESPALDDKRQFHSLVKVSAYENGVVTLSNKMPFPVRVKDVRVQTEFGNQSVFEEASQPLELPATPLNRRATVVRMQLDAIEPGSSVLAVSENPMTGQIVQDGAESLLHYFEDASDLSAWTPLAMPASAKLPDFVEISGQHWVIRAGNWSLDAGLVVPADVVLDIQAGARITAKSGAFILSHGVLNLNGSANRPVVLRGDSGGYWHGIYLLGAQQVSHWVHASLSDLRPFSFGEFELSGALNVYQSALHLEHVTVKNIQAEDAINVIESSFDFHHLEIKQSSSDAIDSDFSNGEVSDSSLVDIGGDGIDTSGSTLAVRDVALMGVADKAISAGEASTLEIKNARLQNIGVGVAAKDYSQVNIQGLHVENARVAAVMAYSKKPEYGGAFLDITNMQTVNVENIVINQLGSAVLLDGHAVPPQKVNVDYYYQQGLMPK